MPRRRLRRGETKVSSPSPNSKEESNSRNRCLLSKAKAFLSAAERHLGSSKSLARNLSIERWSECPPACFQKVLTMCFLRKAR